MEVFASLKKNRLRDGSLCKINSVTINKQKINPDNIFDSSVEEEQISAVDIEASAGMQFALGAELTFFITDIKLLLNTNHSLDIYIETAPFGEIKLSIEDQLNDAIDNSDKLPRDTADDLNPSIIKTRQEFVKTFTQTVPEKVFNYGLDTSSIKGNIEHFVGAAQIPIGITGPVQVNGEHAIGEFLIPMATTEGTLVASYNRGMKLLNMNGGVTATVVGDTMQRAPVFVFENARQARDFVSWLDANIE